jgi:hypothetical protein
MLMRTRFWLAAALLLTAALSCNRSQCLAAEDIEGLTDISTGTALPTAQLSDAPVFQQGLDDAKVPSPAVDRCRYLGGESYCDPGWIGDLELLGWKTRSDACQFATNNGQRELLNFNMQAGMRIGLGYRFTNCWDVVWRGTFFDNTATRSVTPSQPGTLLPYNWGENQPVSQIDASSKVHLLMNDIEVGRWYSLEDCDFLGQASRSLAVRLFGGFRWLDLDEKISAHTVGNPHQDSIDGRNNLGAYGVRLGGELRCFPTDHFSLFTSLAGSALVADRTCSWDNVTQSVLSTADVRYPACFLGTADFTVGMAYRYKSLDFSGGYDLMALNGSVSTINGQGSESLFFDGFFLKAALTR